MPEPRPIDLPAALLLAVAALALPVAAAATFLLVGVVAFADGEPVVLGRWPAAAASGCATVAVLRALTRGSVAVRPAALALAGVAGAAWPLCGAPIPAAAVATLATGLAVRWGACSDTRVAGARVTALLTAMALAGLTAAAATARDTGTPRVDSRAGAGEPERAAAATRDASARRGADRAAAAGAARDDSARDRAVARPDDGVRAAVLAYYRALDAREFQHAWRSLAPGVRASFGGFAAWRAGFDTTVSSRPGRLDVDRRGAEAAVAHVLVARDRAACGIAVQRFAVRWTLRRELGGWRAVALQGTPDGLARCG